MKALMLAAGLGRRLYGDENQDLSKALSQIGGQILIERHIRILKDYNVDELNLIIGRRKDYLRAEAINVAPERFVNFLYNPRYREGPKHSLAQGEELLRLGDDFFWMRMSCMIQKYSSS